MKAPHLLALLPVLCAFTASAAEAQQRSAVMNGAPRGLPGHHRGMHGGRGFFFPFYVAERETVVVEREVVREVPVAVEPPPPPPPPRKPYKVGDTYDSLPSGCMKMIEGGASYYLCSGEWYQQVGSGGATTYKGVAKP